MSKTLDECIEEHLLALAEGLDPRREARRAELAPEDWPRFRARAAALEFLWRQARGEPVAPETFSDSLDEGERALFFESLVNGQLGGAVLPEPADASTIVGERYVILHELGQGGQARVFAAWDRVLELEVALKLLHGSGLGEHTWESSLREESRLLARLQSRNIVRLYDLVRDGEKSYLVMDRVRGVGLDEVLHGLREWGAAGRAHVLGELLAGEPAGDHEDLVVPRSWHRTAAAIAEVMAHTVALAHAQGVVHRDLKPSNVMLVAGGEPVLLDFGLAAREGAARENGLRGTTAYLAPEQARALATGASPLTDVYQLGAILYELLTLQQAVPRREGEGDLSHLLRVARGAFGLPRAIDPEIPEALEAICVKALAGEPERRYASAAELAEDLGRFRRGLAPRHAAISRRCALRMRLAWLLRRPTSAAAAVGVLLALVGAQVFAAASWEPPEVQAFLVEGGERRGLVNGQRVSITERGGLGVTVDCARPSHLYAFSVFGEGEPADWTIRPLEPQLAPSDPVPVLRLDAGRSEVRLTDVVRPESEGLREGLLLFFSQEESELLGSWWRALDAREKELDPLRYGPALEMAVRMAGGGKGVSLARLDPGEREALFARPSGTTADDTPLSIAGVSRRDFVFIVHPQEDRQ